MELNPVCDPKLLSPSKVYRIDGAFYQYLQTVGSDSHPQYIFGHLPTPGQKKKSDLVLNRNKLRIRCDEVMGMTVMELTCNTVTIQENTSQLQLF